MLLVTMPASWRVSRLFWSLQPLRLGQVKVFYTGSVASAMQNYRISQQINQPTQSYTWKWFTVLTGGSAHPGACGVIVEAVVPEVSDFRIRPDPPGLQNQTENKTADESLIRVRQKCGEGVSQSLEVSRSVTQTQKPSHLLQSGYEEHGQSHQMQHGYGDQQEDHGCWETRENSWNSVYRQRNDLQDLQGSAAEPCRSVCES